MQVQTEMSALLVYELSETSFCSLSSNANT